MTIYLLDLNYTLVANSNQKIYPFAQQIEQEEYREDLIEFLRMKLVFLLTARPERYREQTLRSLKEKADWSPERAYFNSQGKPPPEAKKGMLATFLDDFRGEEFIGIESNPATRAMYLKQGISSYPYEVFKKKFMR